jgi:excisionase family DNA binding protein
VAVNREGRAAPDGLEPRPRGQRPLDEPLPDAVTAARLLSVKPSWVYDAARSGRLPHIKLGRHIRFLRRDLEEWVLTRRIGGRAGPRPGQ